MKKVFRFLFDTPWGPTAVCLLFLMFSPVFFFAAFLLQDRIGCFGLALAGTVLFVLPLGVVFLVAIAAFAQSLRKRRWGRAAARIGLLAVALSICIFFAGLFRETFCADFRTESDPGLLWCSNGSDAPLPFELRIRPKVGWFPNPDVQYDKRIAFPSGKCIDLERKEVGYGTTAAYALPDGTFAIADGVDAGLDRRFFRIDPVAETVEPLAGSGDFAARRFLGLVLPDACFDSGVPDPLAPEGGVE
jgi:hypothetical protein